MIAPPEPVNLALAPTDRAASTIFTFPSLSRQTSARLSKLAFMSAPSWTVFPASSAARAWSVRSAQKRTAPVTASSPRSKRSRRFEWKTSDPSERSVR